MCVHVRMYIVFCVPGDATRVVLSSIEGMPGSDYINANYIDVSVYVCWAYTYVHIVWYELCICICVHVVCECVPEYCVYTCVIVCVWVCVCVCVNIFILSSIMHM